MKTSTTFLLAALLVLLASLTAYNMALRTEYRLGACKDPLRAYKVLNFNNFAQVSVPAASAMSVKIVAGPFGVRVNPAAAQLVRVSQQGGQLRITLALPKDSQTPSWGETVVISCPHLAALTTDGTYLQDGQPHLDQSANGGRRVLVQGFRQDSLALSQVNGNHIELIGNRLGYLRAVAGATPASRAVLTIGDNNHIATADLTVSPRSQLLLSNIVIPQLRTHLADSAQLTLSGAALAGLQR
jgi:hypothetical protein